MTITNHPLHRSGRALLTHPAPALGDDALNTLPAPSPVNASPAPFRAPVHDSGPSRLANPLTYDSFIHYNLPIYPGARGERI
jgi:hypothetical protein